MFKKMKDRITDEVNSATNKLQNMQIIDQLTSSIGAQIKNDTAPPDQLLPEPHDSSHVNRFGNDSQFSLIDESSISVYTEEDELNSDISPQEQLFNERTIRKANSKLAKPSNDKSYSKTSNIDNHNSNSKTDNDTPQDDVIKIDDLSSDLDDGLEDILSADAKEDGLDVEIDLLSDKLVYVNNEQLGHVPSQDILPLYKSKYKNVVHELRRLSSNFALERNEFKLEKNKFIEHITDIKSELDNLKHQQNPESTQHDSLLSVSNVSDNDKSSSGSPQPTTKSVSKTKDLEGLLAKCKESLKHKDTLIMNLRESLSEVEKFKDSNQELKRELGDLKEAHETWTVSIAESKRAMHIEIENKNSEIERLKAESHEQQLVLSDSNNKMRQLKSTIQDLESRLVSTSAAHQKERESLTKELTNAKNNAIRQLQKEHQNNTERIKLDLEKSIEALKVDILHKDEQIMKNAEQLQKINEENQSLSAKLDEINPKFQDQSKVIEEARENESSATKRVCELEIELDNLREQSDILKNTDLKNQELISQIDLLNKQLLASETARVEIQKKEGETVSDEECQRCDDIQNRSKTRIEELQQDLHQLNARLDLMNTANYDQEKEIKSLKTEKDSFCENYRSIKSELEELTKKNEQLTSIIKENESDLQIQQDQLDHMESMKRDLENSKKENTSLLDSLNRVKSELSERSNELYHTKIRTGELLSQVSNLKTDLDSTHTMLEDLKKEKDSLSKTNELFEKQEKDLEEKIVMKILSVIKNLETPNTSPGSDKSYNLNQEDFSIEGDKKLPDPLTLMEALSSLALDKSNSYVTATQRLQAISLDNSLLSEELGRLKDELNYLNREKSHEARCSIEEGEKLRTENQALIHDQQAYDDRIKELENEVGSLTTQFEYLKNIGTFYLIKFPIYILL